MGATYWTRPVVRYGIISWTPSETTDYIPFLIDSMVFPGNSGGPVFRIPSGMKKNGSFGIGGPASLVGIVSAVKTQPVTLEYSDDNEIVAISDTEAKSIESFDYMGLAVVVPAEKVEELINQLND